MWPVLVLGLLTAVFAWIWYRGNGEVKEPETQKEEGLVDTAVTAETGEESVQSGDLAAHIAPRECKLHTADPDLQESNRSRQGVSCLGIQATKPDQARNEEKPRLQVKGTEVLSDLDPPGGGQSEAPATANVPLIVGADVPTRNGRGNLPRHKKSVPSQSEQPIYVPEEEEPQTGRQEQPTDVLEEEEPQTGRQEQPTDVLEEEEPQTGLEEQPTDVPGKEKPQTGRQEQPTDVPEEEEQQTGLQEQPTDVPGKEKPQTGRQEQPTDVPEEKEPQTGLQEQPTDVPGKKHQVNILEQQTSVPVKEDNLLEGHLKYLVGDATEEGHKENELHSCEVDLHLSGGPDSREMLTNGDKVYPSLKRGVQLGHEEGYPQDNVDKAVTQTTGEVVCLTVMSEAAGLLGDSCCARIAAPENEPGKEFLQPVKDSQDGLCVSGEMNRAEESVKKATGCPLENVFVKEDAMDVLTAEGTLNQDLYLEMVNTSNNAIFGGHIMKQEAVEKGAINRMYECSDSAKTTGLQENASVFASSLHASSQVGLSDVQKLGSDPKGSSVNIFNQEEMVGLGISNTHEKTSFSCPSEANIREIDHQKTRKVATIQPMPQNVNFVFKVHYITHSDSQIIAITGDHENLGKWETYVPLTSGNGGFWSHSITLPADTNLAWKFVMVENGKITRWEECNNRFLKIAHEDLEAQLWWGYP